MYNNTRKINNNARTSPSPLYKTYAKKEAAISANLIQLIRQPLVIHIPSSKLIIPERMASEQYGELS